MPVHVSSAPMPYDTWNNPTEMSEHTLTSQFVFDTSQVAKYNKFCRFSNRGNGEDTDTWVMVASNNPELMAIYDP